MPRGAKSKLTKEFIEKAVKYKKHGMSNADICRALGIDESTLYKWIQNGGKTPNQIALFEGLKSAESEYKAALRLRIEKHAEKNWQAAAWLLERLYPAEYGRVDRLQAEVQQTTQAEVKTVVCFDYGEGCEDD